MRETGNSPRPRPDDRWPPLKPISDEELNRPRIGTVRKLIYNTAARAFHDPIGIIVGSAFLAIMLWGSHGKLDLLTLFWEGWKPGGDPSQRTVIVESIPWDQEWLSFFAGVLLVVVLPLILVRKVFGQTPADYGLGGPLPGRGKLAVLGAALLFVVSLPAFYLGAKDAGMQATYPLYRGAFESTGAFVVYQLGYFTFFLAIEFIFRGYLLFGLFSLRDREATNLPGAKGPLVFGIYAVFVSMLSYTAWHLNKPVPELWGTLVWGIAAGGLVLASGTIWPIVIVHWLLNVFLDLAILNGW